MNEQIQPNIQNNHSTLRHLNNSQIQIIEYVNFPSLVTQLIQQLNIKKSNNQLPLIAEQHIKVSKADLSTIQLTKQQIQPHQLIPLQNNLTNSFIYYSFHHINTIAFWNVQFNNCEFFSFMNFPVLKTIIFQGSKVHSFKPLIKTNLPFLANFDISKNLASQFNLSRKRFYHNKINIKLQIIDIHPATIQDISCLTKIQTYGLGYIGIQGITRIKQRRVCKAIQQKTQCEIYILQQEQRNREILQQQINREIQPQQ